LADDQIDLHLVGTRTGLEQRLFEESGLTSHYLMARPLPARKGIRWIINAGYLAGAVLQAKGLVRRLRPDAAVGTGGYASVPVLRAAASMGVPTLVHEMDAHAGRANRMLARAATRVTAGFQPALAQLGRLDGTVTGNPLRAGFRDPDPGAARERHGLDRERPLVLVFGGSRGALALSEAALASAPAIVGESGAQIVLITGRGHLEHCQELAADHSPETRAHLHVME
jgi:UDP-N-acetylglucosamine--N-acetylmuramyl-(pentapeptide) pyrophosphoryl-undecaprenol N-acetylglucosamine transferase